MYATNTEQLPPRPACPSPPFQPRATMPERQTLRARLFDPAEAVTRVRRPAAAPPPEADLPSEADPSEAGPSTSTDASAPPPPPAGMDEE
jgi:hypothetical protein